MAYYLFLSWVLTAFHPSDDYLWPQLKLKSTTLDPPQGPMCPTSFHIYCGMGNTLCIPSLVKCLKIQNPSCCMRPWVWHPQLCMAPGVPHELWEFQGTTAQWPCFTFRVLSPCLVWSACSNTISWTMSNNTICVAHLTDYRTLCNKY